MRTPYGNYIEACNVDPEEIPRLFKAVYQPLLAGIKRRGGVPALETLQIKLYKGFPPEIPGRFGVKMEADFETSGLEELINEWQTGGKESGGDHQESGMETGAGQS